MPVLSVERSIVTGPGTATWVLCVAGDTDVVKTYITNHSSDLLKLRYQETQPAPSDVPDVVVLAGKTFQEDVEHYTGTIWAFFVDVGAVVAEVAEFYYTSSGEPGDSGSGDSGLPKHESEIFVPVGGWDLEIQESGGGNDTITIPAGIYYLTSTPSLLAYIEAALNAAPGLTGTYELTADDDYDESTGRVTAAVTGVTYFDMLFSSPGLRDALGFSGSPAGENSHTGAFSSPHIWLPDCQRYPAMAPNGWRGLPMAASTVGSSPSGITAGRRGAERAVDTVEYAMLIAVKVWAVYEVVPNESYETFWRTSFPRRFRFHKNRSNDSVYVTYRALRVDEPMIRVEIETATWTSSEDSLWHLGPIPCVNQDG